MQQYNLDAYAILNREKAVELRAVLLQLIHVIEDIHKLPPSVMSKADRERLAYLDRQAKR